MTNRITAKIKKLNTELAEKENINNFTSNIVNASNNMKTVKLRDQELNTLVNNISKKKEISSKENIKSQRQNEINVSIFS